MSKGDSKRDSPLLNLLRDSGDLASPAELFLYKSLHFVVQPFPSGYQAGTLQHSFLIMLERPLKTSSNGCFKIYSGISEGDKEVPGAAPDLWKLQT